MTFDQATETDPKLCGFFVTSMGSKDITRISQQLDAMIYENKQLRRENQETKQLLNDLTNHTCEIKKMMKEIQKKLEHRDPHIINSQMKANTEPIVLFTKSSNQIVNLSNAQIDNNVAIETYDVNNDNSNISYSNCSRLSLASNASMYNSIQSSSGKPSPAFMQSSKPAKHQLNNLIIGDIVQFVSKKCNVSETAVRSAITTKCADENKMLRQRMEKKRKVLSSMENGNKENDVEMTTPHNLTL